MQIRLETPGDYRAVEALTRDAFWHADVPVPGCDEHYLAHLLRDDDAFIPELDFVALCDGEIVGNIMYSRAWIEDAEGVRHGVCLFGPISVHPAHQRQGVGKALIAHSAQEARRMGYRAVVIYGDPAYYGRQGFFPASRYGITPPDGQPNPALQLMPLAEDWPERLAGVFYEAPVFHNLDPDKLAAFEQLFASKAGSEGV